MEPNDNRIKVGERIKKTHNMGNLRGDMATSFFLDLLSILLSTNPGGGGGGH